MNKNTGGIAFPGGLFETVSCGQNDRMPYNDGMTLRDYFAAKAMKGLIAGTVRKDTMWNLAECAETAYNMADAMLGARENI